MLKGTINLANKIQKILAQALFLQADGHTECGARLSTNILGEVTANCWALLNFIRFLIHTSIIVQRTLVWM